MMYQKKIVALQHPCLLYTSNVAAGGDVIVTATEKDINIKGSNVSGENVTLDAKENINITSSENSTNNDFDASNKNVGASVDVGISLSLIHI